jgi:hypothetical protein
MDQVEEEKRMKIICWRVKAEDRQELSRIVEQTKTPTQVVVNSSSSSSSGSSSSCSRMRRRGKRIRRRWRRRGRNNDNETKIWKGPKEKINHWTPSN